MMEQWRAGALQEVYQSNIVNHTKRGAFSDSIFTFDIEVSSGWINDYGYIHPFDECLNEDYYNTHEKVSLCYLWMFSFEDYVWYGRDLQEFKEVIDELSTLDPFAEKICYIHNASYEFVFLRNLYNKEFTKVFARNERKVMYFQLGEKNITFKCSYFLTNKSLALWGKDIGVEKAVGDLDYNKEFRTPLTPLTERELYYGEMDLRVMIAGLRIYREQYKYLYNIPLTATGEPRRDMVNAADFGLKCKMTRLQPQNMEEYLRSRYIFYGGDVHGLVSIIGKVLKNVLSIDLTSDYPAHLLCKYPMQPFKKNITNIISNTDEYAYIIHLRGKRMKSKYIQHYLSTSRLTLLKGGYGENIKADNGRVISCGKFEMWMTELDYETFLKMYDVKDLEIVESWYSKKNYLPKYFIETILDYYEKKTKLKGVTSEDGSIEQLYMKSKAKLNALYGMVCTNPVHDEIDFVDGNFVEVDKTAQEQIADILDQQFKNFGFYNIGVWCTAYARKELWDAILAVHESGSKVYYNDTDSVKVPEKTDLSYFYKRNKEIEEMTRECCKHYNIDPDRCAPEDIKGKKHPLGVWDFDDGHYSEMVVLGCKRYAYRDKKDGKLHVTVSGVPKKGGAEALHDDITRFKDGFVWEYPDINKLIPTYLDGTQREFTYKGYHSTFKYGINLRPSSYSLDMNDSFLDIVEYYLNKDGLDPWKEV